MIFTRHQILGTAWYRSAPTAAKRDVELYRLLALVDAIRGGRARERQLAQKELAKRLGIDECESAGV